MQLEAKTLTELRGIAQAIGVAFKWEWDKPKLIGRIRAKTDKPAEFPKQSEPPQYPKIAVPVDMIDAALEPYRQQGMITTFTHDAVRMTRYEGKTIKDDSCSLSAPMRVIMDCARRVME